MEIAPHILLGLAIGTDGERWFCNQATEKLAISGEIMEPLIEYLEQHPGCALMDKAPSNNAGGFGFSGVFEDNEKRAYTTLTLPLSNLNAFLSAAKGSSLDGFKTALLAALAEWEKLPTPPTEIVIDHADLNGWSPAYTRPAA